MNFVSTFQSSQRSSGLNLVKLTPCNLEECKTKFKLGQQEFKLA